VCGNHILRACVENAEGDSKIAFICLLAFGTVRAVQGAVWCWTAVLLAWGLYLLTYLRIYLLTYLQAYY
jgi:hypothetical protein